MKQCFMMTTMCLKESGFRDDTLIQDKDLIFLATLAKKDDG